MASHDQLFDPENLTVVIVDDQDPIRKAIRRVVSQYGFGNVIECFDGAAALKVLKSTPVDLIILDLYMRHVSGFEVLEHISHRSVANDIPVIVVTGEASKEDIVKVASLGAEDYLLKPFQAQDLEKKIVKALNRYHAPIPVAQALHSAERLYTAAKYEEALKAFEQTLALESQSPRALVGRALALFKIKRTEEAMTSLQQCLQANPRYHKAYRALADILLDQRKLLEAVAAMENELKINPKQVSRQIQLAKLLLKLKRPELAIQHFRAALLEAPKQVSALMGLGHAFAATGDLDKSIYYFRRVRRHHPTDIKPLEAAVHHAVIAGELRKAEMLLKDVRKLSQDKNEVSILLAMFYLQQQRDDEALVVLKEILAKDPNHPHALRISGTILLKKGDYNEALPVLQRVVELLPTAEAYNNIAELLILMRRIPESLDMLSLSLKMDPQNLHTLLRMAQLHVMTQQWLKANFLFRRAVQLGASQESLAGDIHTCSQRLIARRGRQSA